ncbi:MAG: DUF58 domain-containing protein [Spirochaetia bacterium]|nr:DUF58 domain-containing protein [Spirochaetia bacterium]
MDFLKPGDWELASSLSIRPRRKVSGFSAGEQRSPSLGGGIEFADYREYAPGDDARRVDWSVFMRSRRLMIRLAAEEKDLTLVVVLDASASMDHGQPGKLDYARRLACILAGAAVNTGNRAALAVLRPGFVEALPPERGKLGFQELVRLVGSVRASPGRSGAREETTGAAAARQFGARYGRKCVAVILSDFFQSDWEDAVAAYAASGAEILALQVLSPDELEPELVGEAVLADREDGQETPLHLDASVMARYAAELDAHTAAVASAFRRSGAAWALAPSDGDPAVLFKATLAGTSFIC